MQCKMCRSKILHTMYGNITGCEHYPLKPNQSADIVKLSEVQNIRSDFLKVLYKYVHTDNPVTKASYREILINRLGRGDIS